MNRNKWTLLFTLVLVIVLYYTFDLGRFLTLASLKVNREALLGLYHEHHVLTVFGFVFLYIIQTALSLPGATVFSLCAGLLFGPLLGTIYALISATLGAVLAFLGTRYFLRATIEEKFGHTLENLNTALERDGMHYLLFLRLVPAFPFFMVNLGAALTNLPLKTFILGTAIGIIPGAFVYVNAGASLATINSLSDIVTIRIIGSFALMGFLTLLPVFIAKAQNIRTVSE
jgi:uncharacterized membrane protein YdjX (TVP38/TMEM64 family)